VDELPTLGLLESVTVLELGGEFRKAYDKGTFKFGIVRKIHIPSFFTWNLKMDYSAQF
jgi:hypothetical protein